MKVFIDTNIPMYAAGGEHPFKNSCQDIMISAASGELDAYTDVEVLQEILYRFFHIRKKDWGFQLFDSFIRVMDGCIFPVSVYDLVLARQLAKKYEATDLSPRDLLHLAVMLHAGIRHIITTDKSFRNVEDVTVITPKSDS
jgi:uncharacterized protein